MIEPNPVLQSLKLLWEGTPEPKKGPKPTLTLEQIVQTGVELADQEGLEALSMRKLAQKLGVGAMSLYRYVPSKTELLNLMLDAVSGPDLERESSFSQGWRTGLEAVGHGGRDQYLSHPWLLQVNWTRPVLGPNSVADMELILSGLQDLPLSDREKMNVVVSLDSYVTGAVRQEILSQRAAAESGMTDEEFWSSQAPILQEIFDTGRFPVMAGLDDDTFTGTWEENFQFGLALFLDGVEQRIVRHTPSRG
ncbi:TetR/AcrR family transcriptional regulator [Nesterenkonia cremea]|uniref:TetR family transcriptional regulator n=1 Tax=Nesterenkonia cremea TaxID=1882340 RepID=A0A917AWQ3_9MICC|nr:TetR/AcrR family transcriptional regulator [Nesterenkonia cremea]GGE76427.1 TetR family transcriptional regulator [Nesterenkonia cremea]